MVEEEFEGRTEREAVAKAAAKLGSESFDVEVLEKTGGLFSRGRVKIRVRPLTAIPDPMGSGDASERSNNNSRKGNSKVRSSGESRQPNPIVSKQAEESGKPMDPPSQKIIASITDFIEGIMERMEFPGSLTFTGVDGNKAMFELSSEFSSIIVGKRGKNLDSLQLLANVYLNRTGKENAQWRIVLDLEGYRDRQEESLIRMAHKMADEAIRTRSSRLLDPMNPFERRLVHTAVSDRENVITRSEGDGLYKRVRIMVKGVHNNRKYRNRR